MQNIIIALIVPNAAQITSETDRATASTEIARAASNTIWFDCKGINEGTVLWAVPGAGWVITTQVRDTVVVLQAREDGSPTRGNHLNRTEVGLGRPTLDQHWQALRACLVSKN